MSIEKKLLQFQSEVDAVKKDAKNPFFKSSYVDINGVLKAIQPNLTSCGISYTQSPDIYETSTGNVIDILVTRIYDADKPESFIESRARIIMTKQDSQQYGGAITYDRRYALISMLGLEAEDDDAEGTMNRGAKKSANSKSGGW